MSRFDQQHITDKRSREPSAYDVLFALTDPRNKSGMGLSERRLPAGNSLDLKTDTREVAWVLLEGQVEIPSANNARLSRSSIFDDRVCGVHAGPHDTISIRAVTDCRWFEVETLNDDPFAQRAIGVDEARNEHRGKGALHDASYRMVRTMFDGSTTPMESKLVVGEVVTFPGRWSSYPPHGHPQPELYHYRFTRPEGYGHAELGDDVRRVVDGDTIQILHGEGHAQVAAPGYGMYYLWTIRHLDAQRYDVPVFQEQHRWLLEHDADHWWPKDLP